ncbi:unnamed protein product [Brassica oleracea var. botrytis]|uniref:BnaC08g44810D protein n=3 Tax=Brassica TaxID=3705 RepID=A0A078F658_BRANA|nr:hypothetical protein F2Q69_00063733 [Brassica cretica]CDY09970.1 BnaC08g44810D [Brassica napus]VDD59414.1 unnamed protein product [Brassica oleracea]
MEELREAEANARRKMSEMEREIDKSDDERKVLEAIAARASELEKKVMEDSLRESEKKVVAMESEIVELRETD